MRAGQSCFPGGEAGDESSQSQNLLSAGAGSGHAACRCLVPLALRRAQLQCRGAVLGDRGRHL